jgi:hypothetical protein
MATVWFSLLGLCGQYLCYRAFRVAYPKGDRKMAAILLFLLPSIVYWTSSVGKDALALFFIGWAVFGFARLTQHASSRAIVPVIAGLTGILCVRPHVAGMLASSFALPYALGRNAQGFRGTVVKVVGIPIMIVITFYFATQAQVFLGMDDVSHASEFLSAVASKNNYGNSAFGSASLVARIFAAPMLFFRPFPWEVHNLQSAIASGEAMLLLYLTWHYRGMILAALQRHWRSGFTLFLLLFLAEFSVIFSAAISNFGLLARERTMVIPLFAMFLCVVPRREAAAVRTPLLSTGPSGPQGIAPTATPDSLLQAPVRR